jgi:uncharacterized membrane protein
MKAYKIKKLSLESVATYSAIMYFIGTLIFMLPFGLFMSLIGSIAPNNEFGGNEFQGFGVMLIIAMPIMYAIIGTIINLILAGLYNAVSSRIGGMKFYIEDETDVQVNRPDY